MVVAVWIVVLCLLAAEKCLVFHGKSVYIYMLLDWTCLSAFIYGFGIYIYAKIPLTCVERD